MIPQSTIPQGKGKRKERNQASTLVRATWASAVNGQGSQDSKVKAAPSDRVRMIGIIGIIGINR